MRPLTRARKQESRPTTPGFIIRIITGPIPGSVVRFRQVVFTTSLGTTVSTLGETSNAALCPIAGLLGVTVENGEIVR